MYVKEGAVLHNELYDANYLQVDTGILRENAKAVVDAVKTATGLTTDKITVLKMK